MTPTASACRVWLAQHGKPTYAEELAALTAFVEERELRAKIDLCLQMEEQKWTAFSKDGMVKYTVQWLQELQAQLAARQQR